jgi:hypothetical protein
MANAFAVRHEGLGGRGEASTVGFAMPASLSAVGSTDFGTVPVGQPLDVETIVEDESGFPVMGSTVWFAPDQSSTFSDDSGRTVGFGDTLNIVTFGQPGDANNTNPNNGLATGSWTLNSAGVHVLTAFGVGYASPPLTGDDLSDSLTVPPGRDNVSPAPFEIEFTATACDDAVIGIHVDEENHLLTEESWEDDATARFDFQANLSKSSSTDAVMLVTNDCDELFIGVEVALETQQQHRLTLNFDNDNSFNDSNGDGAAELNDDILVLGPDGFRDKHLTQNCLNKKQSDCGADDTPQNTAVFSNPGTCHILGASSCLVYKISHPLKSQDGAFDIDLAFGQKFGISGTISIGNGAQGNTQEPGFREYHEIEVKVPGTTP